MKNWWKYLLAGGLAGAANGLFGAGGGRMDGAYRDAIDEE